MANTTTVPEVKNVGSTRTHTNNWQYWILNQPDNYRWTDTFKLFHKVAQAVKDWNFGDILEGMMAGDEQRCNNCMTKTTWTDIRTGKARCEKCAVWEWPPEYWDDEQEGGINWEAARGKGCVFVNLAAARISQERETNGHENTDTPFIK